MESKTTMSDLGGIDEIKKELNELVELPVNCFELFQHLGSQPPRGILLCGPPGCGKTAVAHALCGELKDIPFFKLSGPEIISGLSGGSESNIRDIFKKV